MKKLTKIGASALAGSLVAMSAQAGELGVSGIWELTYKSDDNANTANPFGSKSALMFSGSGDVDGLGTASFYASTNDNSPAGLLSRNILLDMGDAGTFGFDQGVGAFGASMIDDKSPTAWEESWHNTANSSGGLVHSGGSGGVLGYSNSVGGFDLSIEYAPSMTTADNGDGAAGGRGWKREWKQECGVGRGEGHACVRERGEESIARFFIYRWNSLSARICRE